MSEDQDKRIDDLEKVLADSIGMSLENFQDEANVSFSDPDRIERLKGIIDCERRSIILQTLMKDKNLMKVLDSFVSAKKELYFQVLSGSKKSEKPDKGQEMDKTGMLEELD